MTCIFSSCEALCTTLLQIAIGSHLDFFNLGNQQKLKNFPLTIPVSSEANMGPSEAFTMRFYLQEYFQIGPGRISLVIPDQTLSNTWKGSQCAVCFYFRQKSLSLRSLTPSCWDSCCCHFFRLSSSTSISAGFNLWLEKPECKRPKYSDPNTVTWTQWPKHKQADAQMINCNSYLCYYIT